MKLVVDTNTLVSGSLWHGPPARLVSAALAGQARMFLSLPMLLELRETLQQAKFAQRLAGIGETAESLTERFRAACHRPSTRLTTPVSPALFRPKKTHFLAGVSTPVTVTLKEVDFGYDGWRNDQRVAFALKGFPEVVREVLPVGEIKQNVRVQRQFFPGAGFHRSLPCRVGNILRAGRQSSYSPFAGLARPLDHHE